MTTKAWYGATPRLLLAIYWASTLASIWLLTIVLAQDSYGLWMRTSLLMFTFLLLWVCASALRESFTVKSYEKPFDGVREPSEAASEKPAALAPSSSRLRWALTEEDIEWSMEWGKLGYPPDKRPAVERVFEDAAALSFLLLNEYVFLNSYWYMEEWPESAKRMTAVLVNLNDVFAWGFADAEELEHAELESLYRHVRRDPYWGAAVWGIKKRKAPPQKPVGNAIRATGIYSEEELRKILNPKPLDEVGE